MRLCLLFLSLLGLVSAGVAQEPLTAWFPHATFRPGWETEISLNNDTLEMRHVTVEAFGDEGARLASRELVLCPGEALQGLLLNWVPELEQTSGWLRLTADGEGLHGMLKFRNTAGGSTSLPLIDELAHGQLFSLMENPSRWPSGLALLNPQDQACQVSLELVSGDGRVVARRDLEVEGRHKLVSMLESLFGEAVDLPERAQIRVLASAAVTGLALSFAPGGAQVVAVPSSPRSTEPPRLADISELTGIWQRDGYGEYLAIDRVNAMMAGIVGLDCLRWSESVPVEALEGIEAWLQHDGSLLTRSEGEIVSSRWVRVDALPDACGHLNSTDDDPELNFEAFWRVFDRHYTSFHIYGVDWHQMVQTQGSAVNAATTPDALFDILSGMVAPLEDGHIFLFNGESRLFTPDVPKGSMLALYQEFLAQGGFLDFDDFKAHVQDDHGAILEQTYLLEPMKHAANSQLFWGTLRDGVGYLQIKSMMSFSTDPYDPGLSILDATLHRVLADLGDLPAMVVDVRFNPGGFDSAAQLIASVFADQERVAFSKRARTPDGFSFFQSSAVEPHENLRYEGNVVLLTSPGTVSAAEIFTLYMRVLPRVVLVGEPTNGAFSDVLMKRLPNGWTVGLSNEEYVSVDGFNFEEQGVLPELTQVSFSEDDRNHRRDSTLELALQLLTN